MIAPVIKGKRTSPRRVLLYGTGGVGKSTFASCAPSPVFLPTEDGLDDIEGIATFPLITTYQEMMDAIAWLYGQEHSHQTAVVDSADWLERVVWDRVCADQPKAAKSIEDIGYAKGYTFAVSYWREILGGLNALRKDRGMHIIITAHSKIEKFEAPDAPTFDRYSPKLHKHVGSVLVEWADEVLFACHKTITKTDEGEGFNKSRTRGIGTGERVIRTTERPAHIAKNRLDLPDEIKLEWAAYASHFIPTTPTQEQ